MASYNPSIPSTAPRPIYNAPIPMADPSAPAGTFAPGTKIQVGSQKVVIQKYFSEGGFAHVYLVKMPKPIDGTDIAVLKRVAVPDKEHLANMRTEVETMKKLKGHRPIVTYYDSHASQLKGGGYEVFLLMEFCNGGGLIDFMNTRLQNRLTEPEILKIFSDVAEGVACMHYLKPPLLHRDLKVENVLITTTGNVRRFKLCDFGSTAPPRPAATTAAECRLIEDDVQKHTTLQYRSPEMIDVYRKLPIDEKSDIWALGVLLYKLCYYTTPFEAQGQLAILNASFKFPGYPVFSDKLKNLIASMLKENPKSRPNIYQVLRESCLMQGIEVPIKDIYAERTQSESRRNQQLPNPDAHVISPPILGAVYSPPPPQQQVIPEVVPMRRGRPTAGSQAHVAKPSPSPMRGTISDPFAALDSQSPPTVDEIANRFPSLDQFSLLHDGGKFDFDKASPTKPTAPKDLGQRVTEKLADDAFASLQAKIPTSTVNPSSTGVSRAQTIISSNPELQAAASAPSIVYEPSPTRPTTSSYVSQGTMTTPTPPPGRPPIKYIPNSRFPPADHHRSVSLPRNQPPALLDPTPQILSIPRNLSSNSRPTHQRQTSLSSRPSLEGGRPTANDLDPVTRTRSSNSRPRPSSTYLESNMDFLREKELASRSPRISYANPEAENGDLDSSDDDLPLDQNSSIDFLREAEAAKRAERRRSSGAGSRGKRASLPSMTLAGTKTLLAGKFGDAFKRFENNIPPGPRTPSPLNDMERERRDLTPIAGSEATDGRSDDGSREEADLAPEQRRELERRRLSMEEARVANAAAEYRKKLAEQGPSAPRSIGGVSKAASIQNKVKSLLDENQGPPVIKTAEGYGRFTDQPASTNPYTGAAPAAKPPVIVRKPVQTPSANPMPIHSHSVPLPQPSSDLSYPKPRPIQPQPQSQSQPIPIPAPAAASKTGGARPNAPPKPMHLNNITASSATPNKPLPLRPSGGLEAKLGPAGERVGLDMSEAQKEDYIKDFSKRFPSLSGIEMVEREIGVGSGLGSGSGNEISVGPSMSDFASGGVMKGGLRTKEV